MLKRILLVVAALVVVLAVGTGLVVAREGSPKDAAVALLTATIGQPVSSDPTTVRIVVENGDTAATVADRLTQAGLIRNAVAFRLIVRLEGLESRLQAGNYDVRRTMPMTAIVASIAQGRMTGGFLTFPEGWRASEIADALDRARVTPRDEFLRVVANPPVGVVASAPEVPAGQSLEGFLFPDSYRFERGLPPGTVASQMLQNFHRRIETNLTTGFAANGLTPYQVVILASIVEREAVAPNERPIIASVYLNRLKRGLRLQADPTVQFALVGDDQIGPTAGGYWKHSLTFADLALNSPFNTYRITGLPPGPICNPGLDSLRAVANPATSDYLYFVAKPDGTHAFAQTLQEHEQNVAKYQP